MLQTAGLLGCSVSVSVCIDAFCVVCVRNGGGLHCWCWLISRWRLSERCPFVADMRRDGAECDLMHGWCACCVCSCCPAVLLVRPCCRPLPLLWLGGVHVLVLRHAAAAAQYLINRWAMLRQSTVNHWCCCMYCVMSLATCKSHLGWRPPTAELAWQQHCRSTAGALSGCPVVRWGPNHPA